MLDTVFAFGGRVRPYNKYLPWELREHPLPRWPADVLLPLVERLLNGDPGAAREAFALVEAACDNHDASRGHTRCRDLVDDWGAELSVLRG